MSSTQSRYDPVAVFLHWATALMIILLLSVGFFMEDFPESFRGDVFTLHKSIGITVLGLSVFRVIWRLMNPPPALPATLKPHERRLAKAAHSLLYVLILAMPLSGWLMVSASRKYPTSYFWLGEVPFIPMPVGVDAKAAREVFGEAHELLAIGAIALITLHIAAALKHHFIYKDTVLTRMLPRWLRGA